jgi:RNA polymerase sigma factor (sigma-70 family)
MSSGGSVTIWMKALAAGDNNAAEGLWERYYKRMVSLARDKLQRLPRGSSDEEDVALSAFHNFCQAAAANRFPRLANRDDLWQILVMLTARKTIDHHKRNIRQKRGGALTRASDDALLCEIIGAEPDPAFAVLIADEFRSLLGKLPDAEMRSIALRKLEGYSNEEIAAQLNCTVRTVGRRLSLIRDLWEDRAMPC